MHEKFRKTIEEWPILREDTGYINYLYSDIRPIYMPPIAK